MTDKCPECNEEIDQPTDHCNPCKVGFEARLRSVCDPTKSYLMGAHIRIALRESGREVACSPFVVFVGTGRINTMEGSNLACQAWIVARSSCLRVRLEWSPMETYIPLVRECKKPEMKPELDAYHAIGVRMREDYKPIYTTVIEKADSDAAMERLAR